MPLTTMNRQMAAPAECPVTATVNAVPGRWERQKFYEHKNGQICNYQQICPIHVFNFLNRLNTQNSKTALTTHHSTRLSDHNAYRSSPAEPASSTIHSSAGRDLTEDARGSQVDPQHATTYSLQIAQHPNHK